MDLRNLAPPWSCCNGRRQMVYPTRDLVNYSNLFKKCFLRTMNCLPQCMKPNNLFALWDWKCKRYMHAPTTASSTEASTRIWMHVPYAVHCVTRLEKMILEMSRRSLPGREFLGKLCGNLLKIQGLKVFLEIKIMLS